MYLSKLVLDPADRAARRCLADCQAMHSMLLNAFPRLPVGATARSHYGVLYRVEDRSDRPVIVYVQSSSEPDWSLLPHGCLADTPGNPVSKRVDGPYDRLRDGTMLKFRLVASPTRKTATSLKSERLAGVRSNGKRVLLADEDRQIEWLKRKGAQFGFELLPSRDTQCGFDVVIAPARQIKGNRSGPVGDATDVGGESLVFSAVTYEGRLRIVDRAKFLVGLCQGIGSGKAYGLGLLSVAPAK